MNPSRVEQKGKKAVVLKDENPAWQLPLPE
jgi:hypothetical protein